MGNKENVDFVRWETKRMLICEVGNKENASLYGGKQKIMLVL